MNRARGQLFQGPRLWLRFGVIGLLIWAAVLGWAFIDYPSPDNLVVGWPVFLFQGGDTLGALRHRPLKFALLLLAETASVFVIFASLGFTIQLVGKHRQTS